MEDGDELYDLPPPQYLGRRRQSTVQEIQAFNEAISFTKKEVVVEKDKLEEVSDVCVCVCVCVSPICWYIDT